MLSIPNMDSVTVSSKYQVVVPLQARKSLHIQPGMKMTVFVIDGRLEYVPEVSVKSLRGAFPNIPSTIEREDDDRV